MPLTPGNDAPAAADDALAAPTPASGKTSTKAFDRASFATATNAGYGSAMGRGLELAVTLLIMVGVGLFLDHLLGTYPIMTILLSVLGFAGITVKLFIGYDLEMKKHEEGAIWNRKGGAA